MPHLHSVIPPYILRRIIESGSEPQQRCARQTLTHVQTLMAHMPGKPAAPHVNKAGQLERDIYDAKQTQELPGTQVRYEGQPSNGDVAVDEAYDYLGITHDFFWKEYQRDSLDNKGLILIGTVHYAGNIRTPSGTVSRWYLETATGKYLTALPSPSTWWRTNSATV